MTLVLDSSALMAFLNGDPGADVVQCAMPDSVMSAVNFSEVVAKLAEDGDHGEDIESVLERLNLTLESFDPDQAFTAGMLRPLTRSAGLSLGDRACIALGLRVGYGVLTADRGWAALDLGIKVRLVR